MVEYTIPVPVGPLCTRPHPLQQQQPAAATASLSILRCCLPAFAQCFNLLLFSGKVMKTKEQDLAALVTLRHGLEPAGFARPGCLVVNVIN